MDRGAGPCLSRSTERAREAPKERTMRSPTPNPFQMIALDAIHESPLNPRKTFDEAALQELAESIKAHGLMQPVRVRPVKVAGGGRVMGDYELVFGHRRVRAARLAGLTEIRAEVVELTDEQVLEVQLVENAKREDIPALEEADAIHRLHKQFGHSVEDIAGKIKKSASTVRSRLKLAAIGPEARKAITDGELQPQVGLLLARIADPKLQAQATKEVLEGDSRWDRKGEPLSYRAALQLIHHKYMLELAKAPFDTEDATLCPKAGACTGCPKRTDAQPDLFAEAAAGHAMCIDPPCFKSKEDAHWERLKMQAKERGQKVLSETETKKVFPYGHLDYSAPYVECESKPYQDNKHRTVKQLLSKAKDLDVKVILARAPSGEVKELIAKDDLPKVLKAAGINARAAPVDTYEAKHRKELAKMREAKRAIKPVVDAAVARLVKHAEIHKPDEKFWGLLVGALMEAHFFKIDDIVKRRGLGDVEFEDVVSGMQEKDLRGLALELALPVNWVSGEGGKVEDEFESHCKDFGIDLTKLQDEIAAEQEIAKADTFSVFPGGDWTLSQAGDPKAHAYLYGTPEVSLCGAKLGTGCQPPKKSDRGCSMCRLKADAIRETARFPKSKKKGKAA